MKPTLFAIYGRFKLITSTVVEQYLYHLLPQDHDPILKTLENQGERLGVPNVKRVTIEIIKLLLKISQPKRILEIGTGIGYSTVHMAKAAGNATIITIEKDEGRAAEAMSHFGDAGIIHRIQMMEGDALDFLPHMKKVDFVFLDAEKRQYRTLFEASAALLDSRGVIVTDNTLFRGWVASPEASPAKYQRMVEQIRAFNQHVMSRDDFDSVLLPIGDGLTISVKK
jgi:caffeoyl-CoA O-methyltransferase